MPPRASAGSGRNGAASGGRCWVRRWAKQESIRKRSRQSCRQRSGTARPRGTSAMLSSRNAVVHSNSDFSETSRYSYSAELWRITLHRAILQCFLLGLLVVMLFDQHAKVSGAHATMLGRVTEYRGFIMGAFALNECRLYSDATGQDRGVGLRNRKNSHGGRSSILAIRICSIAKRTLAWQDETILCAVQEVYRLHNRSVGNGCLRVGGSGVVLGGIFRTSSSLVVFSSTEAPIGRKHP